MKVHGGVLLERRGDWSIEEMELAPPKDNEVLVKIMAAGLCHSDDHIRQGDMPSPLPFVGGHEGAGVVEEVGPGVQTVKPGDHVALAFIPGCGRCKYCVRGQQYVCERGADMAEGLLLDGTPRFFLHGTGVGAMQRLGTFSNYTVAHEDQCIRIDDDIPFEHAALVSCGVTTGWGSATRAGAVKPGEVVVVMGVGGVGSSAVQGARNAGAGRIIAIDPVTFKRDMALKLGATAAFSTVEEATPYVHSLTNGQGADVAICTVGVVSGHIVGELFEIVGKTGTCVVTSVGNQEPGIDVNPFFLTLFAKTLRGSLYGQCNPRSDIPLLLDGYKAGWLNLDDIITQRYSLGQINAAYDDMLAGRNIRGVIIHDH